VEYSARNMKRHFRGQISLQALLTVQGNTAAAC